MFCEHNEKLASHREKKNKNFVMLIFFIFGADSLGTFYLRLIYEENDENDEDKVPKKFQKLFM